MANKFDARQTISRDVLDQLAAGVADKELDDLLRAADSELTMPLRMRASATPDLVVSIDAISVTNPEHGRNKIIPPISNLHPNFASGTVTFPAASGGNITFSSGAPVQMDVSVGQFLKVGIYLDPNGDLTASFGTEGASIAAASSPPSISNVFAIGYVVVENVGGVIQNIENGDIFQYVGGGGGGSGSGDASSVISRLWDTFADSTYDQLTAVDFSSDQGTHVDASSTGSFSLVSNTFEFASAAETLVTTQLLSKDEFLDPKKLLNGLEVAVFWDEGKVDTAATYELSVNGGSSWDAVTMERVGNASDAYIGSLDGKLFDAASALVSELTTDGSEAFDTEDRFAQQITLTEDIKLSQVKLRGQLVGGATGNLTMTIEGDNAGEPDGSTLFTSTTTLDVSTIGGTFEDLDFAFDSEVITAGTYWVVLDGDATYDGVKSGSVHVEFETNTAGSGFSTETAATWTDTTNGLAHSVTAVPTDVRLRITSSAGDVALIGYGLFYEEQTQLINGEKYYKEIQFQSNSAPSTFTLTWIPDPELLFVKLKETGQSFSLASAGDINGWSVDGYEVSFPAGTFTQEVDESFTLVFQQMVGSVDNSDDNANKIATLEYGTRYALVSTNTTLITRPINKVSVDTTLATVQVDLPSSPVLGDVVQIADSQGTFSANNLTVDGNGNNILGAATFTVGTDYANPEFIWVGGTNGWTVRV